MTNKKALILAVGAALAIPCAFAQKGGGKDAGEDADSIVVLYGKVYPELVRQKGKGATETSCTAANGCLATFAAPAAGTNAVITRTEMEASNSRFGLRGHEKLGGGLRAVWQLETQFLVDQNTTAWAQRDSWVGLKGDRWGTIKLGRFDTPFKEYGDDISFLGVSSGNFTSTSAVYRRFGFGTSNSARFHERRTNAVQYESGDFGPFEFKVQYSNGVSGGAGDEQDTATRKPHTWSAGGAYELGNLKLMVGYEMHYDLFGGSRNVPSAMANTTDQAVRSKDKAMAIAMTYKLGRHQFEADYNRKEWKETGTNVTGRFQQYKNNAYIFLWDARWSDQWRTQVHYVRASKGECSRVNATCITDGLEGSQISFGFAYYLSRRTYLFFMGQVLKNGKSAIFASGTQTPNDGEDVTQYAVGIHTAF